MSTKNSPSNMSFIIICLQLILKGHPGHSVHHLKEKNYEYVNFEE